MTVRGLARGVLAGVLLAQGAGAAGAKAAEHDGVAIEADVDITDGPGPSLMSYRLRGRTLTKIVRRGDDGAAVGVWRASLSASDPLPAALAKLVDGTPAAAPAADTPAATVLVRRGGSERRATFARPPADAATANGLSLLEAAHTVPLVTLEAAVLPWSEAHETNGARPVIVRLAAKGTTGAEVRVPVSELSIQMADTRPATPGVTPLPPDWAPVSEPAASVTRTIKPHSPVEVALRAPVPAAGAFAVRAALVGAVSFRAPGFEEQIVLSVTSASVTAPARSRRR